MQQAHEIMIDWTRKAIDHFWTFACVGAFEEGCVVAAHDERGLNEFLLLVKVLINGVGLNELGMRATTHDFTVIKDQDFVS